MICHSICRVSEANLNYKTQAEKGKKKQIEIKNEKYIQLKKERNEWKQNGAFLLAL